MVKEKALKPKPIASVKYIDFGTVNAGTKQAAVITVKNCGGAYKNLKVVPELWFKIANLRHVASSNEITMRLETDCRDPGIIYRGFLTIRMDKQQTKVRVRVRTKQSRKAAVIPKSNKTRLPDKQPRESQTSPPNEEPISATPPPTTPSQPPPDKNVPTDKETKSTPSTDKPAKTKKKKGSVFIVIISTLFVLVAILWPTDRLMTIEPEGTILYFDSEEKLVKTTFVNLDVGCSTVNHRLLPLVGEDGKEFDIPIKEVEKIEFETVSREIMMSWPDRFDPKEIPQIDVRIFQNGTITEYSMYATYWIYFRNAEGEKIGLHFPRVKEIQF